jgi:hypothetical protein
VLSTALDELKATLEHTLVEVPIEEGERHAAGREIHRGEIFHTSAHLVLAWPLLM